jgi:hypothetical protein
MEILVVALLSCSDVQGILESMESDRKLLPSTKTELIEVILKTAPHCPLEPNKNERSKNT